ncbi:methyltransferase family protein [Sphingosinicella rhizophila]|uniref:Isoprenylcysteine carboxylmethyltransferase family protein n=1 Tax=Sphingosinicella rhizophila TaxID=3050082 RepID=A0ABU3Q6Q3_9SPHN|nr:isoprenylcysteine carboxylmethyltransferase family protein [Sphingosinicella sp. GR2756]MDT9599086.1 isoprenylcysteine carboxylmethyltransferase family protein [Sphingosinicella sp. GR2756]
MNAEAKIAPELRRNPRPASAVSTMVGVAGLVGLLLWAGISRSFGFVGPGAALCALLACGIPMIAWSLGVDKVHRNPTTGIDWDGPPRPLSESLDVSLVKIAGLWATWAAIAFAYCLGRWYWDGQYLFSMQVLSYAAVPLLVLSIPYVIWIDRRLTEPRDGAWQLGRMIIGRSGTSDRDLLPEHLRSWTVKGFFLAFMISIVPGNWHETIAPVAADIAANPINLSRWLISAMFMIDVCFATVGYVLTMKPLDAHIRSANPYAAGWMAALICYPPFILMGDGGPLDYHYGTAEWTYWLDGSPLAMALIGFVLVFLTAVYAWATMAFGLRFSNLTHRGILTHGPYAWTKHPAYVSKNLFWWLSTLPFFATTGSLTDIVRNTSVLAIVTGVYYWRARTEEQHLSADPHYREYAEWMEQHGPLPRLINRFRGRRGPFPVPAE